MQVSDEDINLVRSSAQLNQGIRLAQELIAEFVTAEADIRAKRMQAERWLGELIAAKLMMDQHRRI